MEQLLNSTPSSIPFRKREKRFETNRFDQISLSREEKGKTKGIVIGKHCRPRVAGGARVVSELIAALSVKYLISLDLTTPPGSLSTPGSRVFTFTTGHAALAAAAATAAAFHLP